MKLMKNVENAQEYVEMWDTLDNLAIKFVQDLQKEGLSGEHLDEHQLLDTAKAALEAVIPVIEKATGKEFEYIDTDY